MNHPCGDVCQFPLASREQSAEAEIILKLSVRILQSFRLPAIAGSNRAKSPRKRQVKALATGLLRN